MLVFKGVNYGGVAVGTGLRLKCVWRLRRRHSHNAAAWKMKMQATPI